MNYLPGQFIKAHVDDVCEEHNDLPAVIRMIGETDSMVCEIIPMCQACYDAAKQYQLEHPDGEDYDCDICHESHPCKPSRDPEEGLNGPIYWICKSCRKKIRKSAKELRDEEDEYYRLKDERDHREAEDEFYRNQ